MYLNFRFTNCIWDCSLLPFKRYSKLFELKLWGSPFKIDLLEDLYTTRPAYNGSGGGGERGLSSFPVDTEEINGYDPRQSYFSVSYLLCAFCWRRMENTGRPELRGSLMLRYWKPVVSLLRAQNKEDNTVKKKTVFFTLRYEV